MDKYIQYDFKAQQYTVSQSLTSDCIDLLFVNTGTEIVYVNDFPLQPNQHLPVSGNIGEIMHRQIQIRFNNTGGNPELFVVRRFYVTQ